RRYGAAFGFFGRLAGGSGSSRASMLGALVAVALIAGGVWYAVNHSNHSSSSTTTVTSSSSNLTGNSNSTGNSASSGLLCPNLTESAPSNSVGTGNSAQSSGIAADTAYRSGKSAK